MTGFEKSGAIEDKILARNWTLNDVLNLDDTVDYIVRELLDEIDVETKCDIIWNLQPEASGALTFGRLIEEYAANQLSKHVKVIINNYLKTAQVNFDDNTNKTNRESLETTDEEDRPSEDEVQEVDENLLGGNEKAPMSLKDRIRADAKQLSEKEMKDAGLI